MNNLLHRSLMNNHIGWDKKYFTLRILEDEGVMTLYTPDEFETKHIKESLLIGVKFIRPFTSLCEIVIDSTGTDVGYIKSNDYFYEYGFETPPNSLKKQLCIYKSTDEYYFDEGVDYNDIFFYSGTETVDGITYDKWRKAERDDDAYYWSGGSNSNINGEYYILTEQITTDGFAYSLNDGEWVYAYSDRKFNGLATYNPIVLSLKKGDCVKIKCVTDKYIKEEIFISGSAFRSPFECTCDYEVYGNIMSLLYGDDFVGKTEFKRINDDNDNMGGEFSDLFRGQNTLKNCKNLILPATTLKKECYSGMFFNCHSLTSSPVLPASILAEGCYREMFYECENLNKITMLAVDITAYDCLKDWVNGVATSGTFVKHISMRNLEKNSVDGIPPTNWVINDYGKLIYEFEYFTLNILGEGSIKIYQPQSIENPSYSLNGGEWKKLYIGDNDTNNYIEIKDLKPNDKISVKCNSDVYYSQSSNCVFDCTCDYEVYGNIMSLLYGDNFVGKTEFKNYNEYNVFGYMFNGQKKLKNCKNLILPTNTLSKFCYCGMFSGCTALMEPPKLQAMILSNGCYQSMFRNCTSLKMTPELPAIELKSQCYEEMFYGCVSITTSPVLSASKLVDDCYSNMFRGCKKLNKITMLAEDITNIYCLNNWVNDVATSGTFVKHPNMDTDTLTIGVNGIPEGWVIEDCDYYDQYFTIHTLTNGGNLKIKSPFYKTYNIIPSLVTGYSFNEPFEVLGTILVDSNDTSDYGTHNCIGDKFYEYGYMMDPDGLENQLCIYKSHYAFYPEEGVDTSDVFFYCGKENVGGDIYDKWRKAEKSVGGVLRWNYLNGDAEKYQYYYFLTKEVTIEKINNAAISYSLNGGNWIVSNSDISLTINKNTEVRLKSIANTYYRNGASIECTCDYEVYGNIMSLLYGDDFVGKTNMGKNEKVFDHLFYKSTTLKDAKNLILPATILTDNCYESMFSGCTALMKAPELPATELKKFCYGGMFESCISLTKAPDLPATTLAKECYYAMFYGCSSLIYAPSSLPATTLYDTCYYKMFYGCSSLETSPDLPATILVKSCYAEMFKNCIKLEYIKMLSTDTTAAGCLTNWVSGVSSTGTFVKYYGMNSLPENSNNGIPSGWIIKDGWPQEYYEYFTIRTLNKGELSLPTISNTEYSLNNGDWCSSADIDGKLIVGKGDEIRVRSVGDYYHCCYFGGDEYDEGRGDVYDASFKCKCKYEVYGNIMSLVYGSNFTEKNDLTEKSEHTFSYLFYNESNLVSADRLIFPATTLERYCYQGIFCGCTGLKYAPPILPATTLKKCCYEVMFSGCTDLSKSPELPAKTLTSGCYSQMFKTCENLKYIKMLCTSISDGSLYNWVNGVASSGTFVKNTSMNLQTGVNGIPSGWTVKNQTT